MKDDLYSYSILWVFIHTSVVVTVAVISILLQRLQQKDLTT